MIQTKVGRPVSDELIQLAERAGVEQIIQSLAGDHFTLSVLALNALTSSTPMSPGARTLKALNMTRGDLEYEKLYVKDPYRLKIADKCLIEPLSCPLFADDMQRRVAAALGKPDDLVRYMGECLDLEVPAPVEAGEDAVDSLTLQELDLPAEVKSALALIIDGIEGARPLIADAFSSLT